MKNLENTSFLKIENKNEEQKIICFQKGNNT
jgi:hypothetical protein